MRRSKADLLIAALLSRGFSEHRASGDPLFAPWREFSISPSHARRLDRVGSRVWVSRDSGSVKLGLSLASAKSMPVAMRRSLYLEGQRVLLRPILSLKEIGL